MGILARAVRSLEGLPGIERAVPLLVSWLHTLISNASHGKGYIWTCEKGTFKLLISIYTVLVEAVTTLFVFYSPIWASGLRSSPLIRLRALMMALFFCLPENASRLCRMQLCKDRSR